MSAGMNMRMKRIFKDDGNSFILPFDHGVSSGIIDGLDNIEKIISVANIYADAIMVRPGLMRTVSKTLSREIGVILCLTGRLYKGVDHVKLNSVIEALKNGADAICVEFKVGSPRDLENVSLASALIEEAHQFDVPALVTVYPQNDYIEVAGSRAYIDVCRIAEEIGADFVKTHLPNEIDIISSCVKATSIPIIMAGGEKDFEGIIKKINYSLNAGINGVAVGRNVWGAKNPDEVARKIKYAVHSRM